MEYPDGMSEYDATWIQADQKALEALNADGAELERIEELLDQFNVLEAIGFIDNEVLRRSDYDLDRAVERIRATGYPDAEYTVEILLEPPDPERVADFFEQRAAGDRHGFPSTP
jgi:hypothetical protein